MKLNVKQKPTEFTHEGAPAKNINVEQQLRRSVMSCMLWENGFYEEGEEIGARIISLAEILPPEKLAAIAIEARKVANLRHVPLLLLSVLCRTGAGTRLVSDTIYEVVSRADELTELLAIYWKDGKKPLSAQLKKGLARAFNKFDAYQLGKYNRDGAIKLRDVMFLTHAKPGEGRDDLYKKLAEKTLESPDTWEVALSAGADKKDTFTRLIQEGNLGYFALLRNLRNMEQSGVDPELIRQAIIARKSGADKVLPFRFVAAARYAPRYERELDASMLENISKLPALSGETVVLVDVSGSMNSALSGKSDMKRIDAAAALASIINGNVRVFSFSDQMKELPPRKGMAGIDSIIKSQPHGGTRLGEAITALNENVKYDRLIVITDEQSASCVPGPKGKGYMINVASNKNGVGYHEWTHIDGFSENVILFIVETESNR